MVGQMRLRVIGTALLLVWASLILVIAFLMGTPTSIVTQLALCAFAIGTIILMKPFAQSGWPRFVLLAVGSTIVLRYWLWRVTSTLPDPDDTLSFVLAVVLLIIETYSIAVFFLNAFLISDPTTRTIPPSIHDVADLPTVDVLIPSYNEPTEMLAVTLAAAKNMIYPENKRKVVLCDDGGTDEKCSDSDPQKALAAQKRRAELQKLCADLGITYSTRSKNEHAKAGNMSAALEKLNGELVVVFDADHVPTRDFLARTVGYFQDDPKLFLVQTPHFFINRDPIERNLGLTAYCPPENEMFYGLIHRGIDRWGGAFFCGSASVLRRKALDDVGGFSGETITEDAETALDIHSRGWKSLYLNRAMIGGLQPETFASFIVQRGRWATGMIQMMMLKNPLFKRGLTFTQRLCYLNSMNFWLFPIVRLVYVLAPLTYLMFGVQIFRASLEEAVAYSLTYVLVSFLVQNALFAKYRWPFISEIYETAQAPYLAKAIVNTVLHPRKARFNVTAKDETLATDYISPIYKPLLFVFLLCVLAVILTIVRWIMLPGDRQVLSLVGGWAIFNLLLVSLALRATCEKQQRRASPRINMRAPALVALPGSDKPSRAGTIIDASTTGAQIVIDRDTTGPAYNEGDTVVFMPRFADAKHLEYPVRGIIRAMGKKGDKTFLRMVFPTHQPAEAKEAVAFLIFGNSDNWLRMREIDHRSIGFTHGTLYILWMALKSLPKTIRDYLDEPARRKNAATTNAINHPAHLVAFGTDFFDEPSASSLNPEIPKSGNAAEAKQSGVAI